MRRAWAIFRKAYNYRGKGGTPFLSIGRKCFGWALRKAWAEAREAARRAALPAEQKQTRIEVLLNEQFRLEHADTFLFQHATRRAAIAAELAA